jgi:kynurenine formamidase
MKNSERPRGPWLRWALCGALVPGLAGLACGGDASAPSPDLDLSRVAVVDLSYPYEEQTLYWPTSPSSFKLTQLSFGPSDAGYFYAANTFCTPEHGGTHIDAPIHFAENGWTVGEIPLSRLFGPGVVIDISAAAAVDRDTRLTVAQIEVWEAQHGRIPEGAIVLLRSGWGAFWPDARSYLGDDTPGDASNLHFPSYGEESARFLIEKRGVAALGVDTASIDYGQSDDFVVHQVVAAAGVPGLENVAHLERVSETGSWILALPMKIGRGSGGPVRIVALTASL